MISIKEQATRYTGIIFSGLFIVFCMSQLINVLGKSLTEYVTIEGLINYDHGFVRRGLLGTFFTSVFADKQVLMAINLFSKSVFMVVILLFAYLLLRPYRSFSLYAPLLLSPVLFAFAIHNRAVIGRVEWFGILITTFNCYLVNRRLDEPETLDERRKFGSLWWYTVLIAVLPPIFFCLFLFIHEGLLLISVPINFIITFVLLLNTGKTRDVARAVIKTMIIYSPVCLVFVLILIKGQYGPEYAVKICEGVRAIDPSLTGSTCEDPIGPFKFFTYSIFENVPFTLRYISDSLFPFLFLALLGLFFSLYSVISGARYLQLYSFKYQPGSDLEYSGSDHKGSRSAPTLGDDFRGVTFYFFFIPAVSTIPLFLTGIDWGRWFFVLNSQFILVLLILYRPTSRCGMSQLLPCAPGDGEKYNRIVKKTTGIRFPFFILPVLVFQIPYVYPGKGYKMFFTSISRAIFLVFRFIFS